MNTQDKVISLAKEISKMSELDIHPSTNLKDLDFDSLDLLEFQLGIDNAFGIEVDIVAFLKLKKVEDLIALVDQHCSSK